jgi:hypothetical protein
MADVYFRLIIQDHDGIHDTDEELSLANDLGGVDPAIGDLIVTAAAMRGSSTFKVVQRIHKPGGQISLVLVPEILLGPLREFCGQ